MSLWPYVRPGEEGLMRLHERYGRTLDPAALTAALADAGLELDGVEVSPLTIKKDRFLARVDARARDGGALPLIAKGWWDDRGRRVLANHRALWDAGLAAPGRVRTSRPLAYLPELGVLLSERLPGRPFDPHDSTALARAGEAAARLHACAATLEPRFGLPEALDNAERHARMLDGAAVALVDRARSVAAALGPLPSAPLHGDLSPDSYLLDGDSTYLIDWDISCSFDPAWDVGHMLAMLRRFALERGGDHAAGRRSFLDAYSAAADMEPRVVLFEALVCVHKAYTVQLLGAGSWRSVMQALLASAGELLAGTE